MCGTPSLHWPSWCGQRGLGGCWRMNVGRINPEKAGGTWARSVEEEGASLKRDLLEAPNVGRRVTYVPSQTGELCWQVQSRATQRWDEGGRRVPAGAMVLCSQLRCLRVLLPAKRAYHQASGHTSDVIASYIFGTLPPVTLGSLSGTR